jgi:hypothetical protein
MAVRTQQEFVYSTEALAKLVDSISAERLEPYLIHSKGDLAYAMRLYEWNISLSESLWGLMQTLEVSLRNAMHISLTQHFARADWYEVCPLFQEQKGVLKSVRDTLKKDGKTETPGRIVAELSFGFWTGLTGPSYAQVLWDRCLHKAFPHSKSKRKAICKRLNHIRLLRNRVAHHESIIGKGGVLRNLKQDAIFILEAVGWICPVTTQWISTRNSFFDRFAAKPKQ